MGGTLHFDLAFQPKAIIGGTDIMIGLIPNDIKFAYHLVGDYFDGLTIDFTDIVFFVHRAKVSKELEHAHREALLKAPARYPYTKSVVRTATVSVGLSSCNLDNIFMGPLPRRIFIATVLESTYNGNIHNDTMNFINSNISRIVVLIDGKQYPNSAYQPKFTNVVGTHKTQVAHCTREYRGFLKALNENRPSARTNISLSEWSQHPIYGFNFCGDLSNGGSHICPSRHGQLNIRVDFSTPLKEAVVFLIYAEFDRLMEIDRFGGVSQS